MQYEVSYLPLFWEDVHDATNYISDVLMNVKAANNLLDELEARINVIQNDPLIALKYRGNSKLDDETYWFSVGNYMAFYVIKENIIEFRRFLYDRRDFGRL